MLLMVEKGIRGGLCHYYYQYGKTNSKCMKDYDKNKELSYLQHWNVNNLYGWIMSQLMSQCQYITMSGSKILLSLMKIS